VRFGQRASAGLLGRGGVDRRRREDPAGHVEDVSTSPYCPLRANRLLLKHATAAGAEQDEMTRRIGDPRERAEAAFKQATTKPLPELPAKQPSIPGTREQVSLRIDRDVLDFFQEEGPGWQERINAALRKAAGK
jgi:uncharacterized protein (DUF4415 family)